MRGAIHSADESICIDWRDPTQVAALYFGVQEDGVPEEIIDVLVDKSHGHPQFAKELVCLWFLLFSLAPVNLWVRVFL